MPTHQQLLETAMEQLEEVDFVKCPQMGVAWRAMVDSVAEQLAENTINLPWEEWADTPEETS